MTTITKALAFPSLLCGLALLLLGTAQAGTVIFAVPDNFLNDNNGGVSVVVTVVPEASTVALLTGAGVFAGIATLRKRRRRIC